MARKSNFELLRIIAILIIIMHHYAQIGCNELLVANVVSGQRLFSQFLFMGGKVGVNLFVLISGYFLCKQEFRLSKLVTLLIWIFTYSVVFMCVLAVFFDYRFGIFEIVQSLFPVTFNRYIFPSTYVLMYLFVPFINHFINTVDKKMYQRFILIGGIVFVVLPTLTAMDFMAPDLVWFIYLYLLAAYIRIYEPLSKIKAKHWLLAGSGMYGLLFLSMVFMDFVGLYIPAVGVKASYFIGQNRLPAVLSAVLLFVGFSRLEMKTSKCINYIGGCAFGIFLFHTFPWDYNFLWIRLLKTTDYIGKTSFYLHAVLSILLVFGLGLLFESIRRFLYKKTLGKLVARLDKKGIKE